LNALQESDTKASFFMLGQAMEKYPEIVRELISNGHTLGYHSYTHTSLIKRSFKELIDDVAHMNRLSDVFQYPIRLYRPPFGDLTITAVIYFILKGKKIIMWSLDSRDSFEGLEEVQRIISPENISPGEIILFHDDYDDAEKLITSALQYYQKANIDCDTL
jgi:peptidoglycan/xylan/chitin deacetylase (PgdA/CDA1 family)